MVIRVILPLYPLYSSPLLSICQIPSTRDQLFAYHRSGDMFAAAPPHFLEVFLYHRIIPIGDNGCLVEGDAQIPVAIFVFAAMAMFSARILTARYQPAIADELFIRWKPGNIADLSHHRPGADQSETGKDLKSFYILVKTGLLLNGLLQGNNMILCQTNLIQQQLCLHPCNLRKLLL